MHISVIARQLNSLCKLLSGCIVFLGIFIMGCWIFGQAILYPICPTIYIMTFNTSLCFVVAGAALLLPEKFFIFNQISINTKISLGLLLFFLAAIIFSQALFNISLNVDQLFINVKFTSQEIHPGRMSPQTAFCFILTGFVLCLSQFMTTKSREYLTYILILSIFIIGLIAFLGYIINANFIHNWQKYGRMSPHTSIGFILLSVSLGLNWFLYARQNDSNLLNENSIINYFLVSICTMILVVGGMFGIILWDKLTRTNIIESTLPQKEAQRSMQ